MPNSPSHFIAVQICTHSTRQGQSRQGQCGGLSRVPQVFDLAWSVATVNMLIRLVYHALRSGFSPFCVWCVVVCPQVFDLAWSVATVNIMLICLVYHALSHCISAQFQTQSCSPTLCTQVDTPTL